MHLPNEPDPCADLLSGPAAPAASALRTRLLAQTTSMVRRRRRLRQGLYLGALAAGLLLGVCAALWWPRGEAIVITKLPPPPEDRTPAPPAPSALAQEWRAVDATADRAKEFLAAGDRYLEEEQDAAGALRCYRQALDAAPAQALDFSPDDNWLVMALKDARRKEKTDATNSD